MRKITYPLSLRSMVSAVLWCVSAVCTQAADYDQFSLKVGESTFTYTVTSEADKTVSLSKVEPLPNTLEIPDRVTRPMQGSDSNGSGVYTVTYVSRWTYGQNLQVHKLVLPATIKDASAGCFAGWIGLDSVVCHGTYAFNGYYNLFSASPEKFDSNYDRYMSIYYTARLCVPFGSYRSYAWTNPWGMFTHISEGLGEHSLLQPVFDRDGGEYDEKFGLTLTNPNNVGEIYYYTYSLTDGLSGPQRYNGPIEIGHSCTVTAYVTDGTHCSDALSKTYTVSGMTLYVAGMEVNSKNQWDILGDKGSVAFDSRSARLIMDNANINCMDYKAQTAIEAWDGDLTIELRGDNVITTGYQGIDYGYGRGRGTGGRLRIEGDKTGTASLTINCDGKWTQAINLYLANMDIANCRVIVRQATTGIYSKAGGKDDGTLSIDMEGTLDITSTQSAITGIHTLSLGKDMAILRPAGARFVAANPYDDKEKEKDSYEGNIVVADKVQTDVLIGPRQQEPALPIIRPGHGLHSHSHRYYRAADGAGSGPDGRLRDRSRPVYGHRGGRAAGAGLHHGRLSDYGRGLSGCTDRKWRAHHHTEPGASHCYDILSGHGRQYLHLPVQPAVYQPATAGHAPGCGTGRNRQYRKAMEDRHTPWGNYCHRLARYRQLSAGATALQSERAPRRGPATAWHLHT